MSAQIERTYLEIRSINKLLAKNKPFKDLYLEKVNPPDFQLNKFFYKEKGKKHSWTDRLVWNDKKWISEQSSKKNLFRNQIHKRAYRSKKTIRKFTIRKSFTR